MYDQHNARMANMDMSALIGYARVPTAEQSLEVQIGAPRRARRHQAFTDVANGAKADRPGLDKALKYLCDGDTLAMWKISRLGRSLVRLVQTIDALHERGIGSRSLTDAGIDTTTCSDRLLFNLFATLAESERDLINERAKVSLAAAKARDRSGGRRAAVTPEKLVKARRLMDKEGLTIKEAAAVLDVGRLTFYRALNVECDTPTESSE